MMKQKNMAKAAVWSIICTIMTSTINFIIAPLFTRILTPSEFGNVNTFNSYFIILCIIISLQLSASISKAFFDFKSEMNQYVSSIVFLSIINCFIFGSILLFFNQFIFENIATWKIIYMILACFSTGILNIYFVYERFQYKYKMPVFITIINAISNVVISLVLIKKFPDAKADAKIGGGYLSIIFFGIGVMFFFLIKGKKLYHKQYWKYGLFFSIPNIIHTLGMQIINQSDRLMIQHLNGSYAVGMYSVPYSVCAIINTLWSSILVVINPWLYRTLELRDFQNIQMISKTIFRVILFIVISFVALAPEVMKILIGSEFYKGIYIMPPIAIGIFFSCIYTLFCTMENQYRKVIYTPIGTLAAAIINIILNYYGIKIWGYAAAAYTSAFCYLLLSLFHGKICVYIEKERVFPLNDYIELGIICILSCMGLLLLYDFVAIRYIVWIFLTLILSIRWKEEFVEIIKIAKSIYG